MVTRISSHVLDDDAVGESKIQDGAVTTGKIADGSVATGKIADDAVTPEKIPDDSITNAKLADIGTSPGNLAALVDDGGGNGIFTPSLLNVGKDADQIPQYEEIDGAPRQNHSNMPYVDGVPIVESGSNSDGSFFRSADGTQFCYVNLNAETEHNWTFPQSFSTSSPVTNASVARTSPTGRFATSGSTSATSTDFFVFSGSSGDYSSGSVRCFAIGAWL